MKLSVQTVFLHLLMTLACCTLPSSDAHDAARSTYPSPSVRLQAMPDTISEGETEAMEIQCHYAGPASLVSIGIVRKDTTSEKKITLAHVTANKPKHVVTQNGIQAEQVSGEIKADGQSGFLSIKWPTPDVQLKGLYQCQAVVLVAFGSVVKTEGSVRVKGKEITLASILRIMKSMKGEFESLKEKVDTLAGGVGDLKGEVGSVNGKVETLTGKVGLLTGEVGSVKGVIGSLKSEVGSVKSKIGSVQGVVGWIKGVVDILLKKQFTGVRTYRKHTYFLVHRSSSSNTKAQAFCQSMGGYLAEINDRDEYQFILDFVTPLSARSNSKVLLGGTDANHEGTWVFQRTNKPVEFFDWIPGEPNNRRGREHCLDLWNSSRGRFQMNDGPCESVGSGIQLRILCEVPIHWA